MKLNNIDIPAIVHSRQAIEPHKLNEKKNAGLEENRNSQIE